MPSSEAVYVYRFTDGVKAPWLPGKAVCVGRNYADHVRERGNLIPDEPLSFIKSATTMVPFNGKLALKYSRGVYHYETEMTLLMGKPLSECSEEEGLDAIADLGIGLDLTLRQKQEQLKTKGQSWEHAKAFDGSCVLSYFAKIRGQFLQSLDIRLTRNYKLVQNGNAREMFFPVATLLADLVRADASIHYVGN